MINIAIMGFGTVGSGVAEVLETNAKLIEKRLGEPVKLKHILDIRDLSDTPYADIATNDFEDIVSDPEVDIVVETIGGATIAGAYTLRALRAGKHVITSNKELVAQRGCELLTLAKEKGVNYLFEASVGGGIPLIRPIHQCLAGNEIEEVYGILNGTTNYILSRMVRGGASYEVALQEAKDKGYAEADPAADISGLDTCRKICILSDMAFGTEMPVDQVPTEGIEGITLHDVEIVEDHGFKVKLLGRALRDEAGHFCAYVAPHLLDAEHPLASMENETNAVVIRGNALGEAMFVGPGAGKLPTASAVVADIIDAARHMNHPKDIRWEPWDGAEAGKPEEIPMRTYYRVADSLEDVERCFPGCEILHHDGEVAFITPKMKRCDTEDWAERLHVLAKLCVLK